MKPEPSGGAGGRRQTRLNYEVRQNRESWKNNSAWPIIVAAAALLLGIFATTARGATPSLVQWASYSNGPIDEPICTAAFGTNTTPGNTIIVAVVLAATSSQRQVLVNDTQGNIYYPAGPQTNVSTAGGGQSIQLFYAFNIIGGPDQVTATEQGGFEGTGNAYNQIAIHEYSGISLLSPFDGAAAVAGVTTSAPFTISTGTINTSTNGDLVFAFGMAAGTLSAGTGFSARQTAVGISEDAVQASAGAIAASAQDSLNGDAYAMVAAAFKPAGSSHGPVLPSVPNTTVAALTPLIVTNRAADVNLKGEGTNVTFFNYPNRAALLAAGWSFIATNPNGTPRNTEITNSSQGAVVLYNQSGTLQIPCDLGNLENSNSTNNSRNTLFQALPPNWTSLRLTIAFVPTENVQQARLGIYQDDNNYIEAGVVYNSAFSGQVASAVSEAAGVPVEIADQLDSYQFGLNFTNVTIRLDRQPGSSVINAFFSLNHFDFGLITSFNSQLVNPRLMIWAGGSPVPWTSGLPVCSLEELDVLTNSPTELAYELVNPPTGAAVSSNGVITWTPNLEQASTTNILTTVVTDNGTPPLSATNSFSVVTTPPSQNGPTLVQTAAHSNGTVDTSTCSVTFSNANTAGNLIIAEIEAGGPTAQDPVTVSDSLGNTYQRATSQIDWQYGESSSVLFYAANIKGGANTVTFSIPGSVVWNIMEITEYSGIAWTNPVDVTATAVGVTTGAGQTLSSGSVTTTYPGELIFGAGHFITGPMSAGTGFTSLQMPYAFLEDTVQAKAGSIAATFVDGSNNDPWSVLLATFKPLITKLPTAPTGLVAQAVSPSQINLSWAASTDLYVVGYNIYRNGSKVGTSTTTNYQDTGLAASTTYTYTVAAYDFAGNTSAQSSAASATTQTPDTTPPTVPTNVSATAVSPVQINLAWTPSTDPYSTVTGYDIYRNGILVATSTTTNYQNTGLSPSTSYSYTVAAYDLAGNTSAQSSPASATTPADTTPPTVPTNLAATAISPSQINLSWTASTDPYSTVTGYNVYRNGTKVGTSTTTIYQDTGLAASTTYTYTVAAYDAVGNTSAQSSSVAATTQTPGPKFVQSAAHSNGALNTSACSVTFPSANTAGDLIVVDVEIGQTPTADPISLSDSQGNTYHPATTQIAWEGGSSSAALFYAANIKAGANTVTMSIPGSAPWNIIEVVEYSGVALSNALDVASTAVGVTTAAGQTLSSGTVTNNSPGELIFGAAHAISGELSTGTGFTSLQMPYATLENTVQAKTGPTSATVVDAANNDPWAVLLATFRSSVTTPPTVPTNLVATGVSPSQINLSWSTSTDTNAAVAGYDVYRNGKMVGTSTTTNYQDTGLAASTTYTYTVAAYDGYGNTSAQSSAASATTQPPDTTPPTVPTNVMATAMSPVQINIVWAASTDPYSTVTGYDIYRNGTLVGTSTTTNYQNTGLSPSTSYTYTVAAYDLAGNTSAQSSPASATTSADTTPPTVPTNLVATAVSSSQINLAWTASTDSYSTVTGYNVYRNGTKVGTSTTTNYQDTGLSASTTYTYTVAAYDAIGNTSAQSSSVSATTQAPGPKYVQSAAHSNGSLNTSTCSVTFPSANAAGDLIVVDVEIGQTPTADPISLSDSLGNTYLPATTQIAWEYGESSAVLFYAANIKAGTNTVTMSIPGSAPWNIIEVVEYSGVALTSPLDVASTGVGVTTATGQILSSGTATNSSPNELIFGAGHAISGEITTGTGFTSRQLPYALLEDMVQPTAGPVAATVVDADYNDPWAVMMATFKPAGGAAPGAVPETDQSPPATLPVQVPVSLTYSPEVGTVKLTFKGAPGRTYSIESAAGVFGPWKAVGAVTVDSTGQAVFSVAAQTPTAFFRVSTQ